MNPEEPSAVEEQVTAWLAACDDALAAGEALPDPGALADQPAEFARRVVDLLRDPQKAAEMAARAREEVVTKRDIRAMTERMVEGYRAEVLRRNAG